MGNLIFIHGSGSTASSWHYQTSYFDGSEAVNLPGHPEGNPCTSVEDYTDWLRHYIREKGYHEVVLAGHSLGGAIAIDYGLRHPEDLGGLILIGTGARLRVHPDFLEWCRDGLRDIDTWLHNWEPLYVKVHPELQTKLLEDRKLVGPKIQLNDLLCCDKFNVMGEVSRIKLPTLILCGSEDQMTPVKYSEFLASNIEGSQKIVVQGATHLLIAEKPSEVNQIIERFLRAVQGED